MFSDPVVVAVDVGEGFASGLIDGFEEAAVEQFGLESGPEAFGHQWELLQHDLWALS